MQFYGSLRSFSASNTSPKGLVLVLRAYLDSSGDLDSRHYRHVTLAGYSANHTDWPKLERDWSKAVRRAWSKCRMPNETPYLHTVDLMSFSNPFSRRNGWNEKLRDELLDRCVDIIAERNLEKMRGASSTINLADYKEARTMIPEVPHIVFQCPSFVVGGLMAFGKDILLVEGAELYFDRGDPFCGSILERWNNKTFLRRHPVWNKIKQVGQVNMKDSPAMQAADLLAWSANAEEIFGDWQVRLLGIPRHKERLDEVDLQSPNRREMKKVVALKLASRREIP